MNKTINVTKRTAAVMRVPRTDWTVTVSAVTMARATVTMEAIDAKNELANNCRLARRKARQVWC
jgi:hypothetical protein